MKYLLNNFQNL